MSRTSLAHRPAHERTNGVAAGGFCDGPGSTAKMITDCGNCSRKSIDGKCSGGFCPGTGCTARQTNDCQTQGKACGLGKCL